MKSTIRGLGIAVCLTLAIPTAALSDDDSNNRHFKHGGKLRESIQVADHFMFQPNGAPATIAPGATILIRDLKDRVITATVTSAALTPHYAYSIWWVVFNRPQFCAVPYECGSGDLGNDQVKGSVFWGGGLLADAGGYGNTQLELREGRVDRELFGPMNDHGLRNLKRAEVHLVLRTHEDAGVAGTVAKQIGTANEACPLTDMGEPDCRNVFFSVHRATD